MPPPAASHLLGVEVVVRLLQQCAHLEQLAAVGLVLGAHRLQLTLQLLHVQAELLHTLQAVAEVAAGRATGGGLEG